MAQPDPNPTASDLAGRAAGAAFVASRDLAVADRSNKRRHPGSAERERRLKTAVDRLETALRCARGALDEVTRERTEKAKAAANCLPRTP
jgi:hypothetical protein